MSSAWSTSLARADAHAEEERSEAPAPASVDDPTHEQSCERADERAAFEAMRSSGLASSGARSIVDADEMEIAASLLDGDGRRAIGLCARVHGASVGRLCFLLLGTQGEADEAAQETMLAAFHAARSYRGEGTARAWLFSIARRVCAQRAVVRTRQARRRVLLHDASARALDASQLHDAAEDESRVRDALDTLPVADREILVLRYEAEQSFREIAALLDLDEATARKRVGRALGRLREKVER